MSNFNFQVGDKVTVYEPSGNIAGRGVVVEVDECALSFTVRNNELLAGHFSGFDLRTGRETMFTDGIEDEAKTLALGRSCKLESA